MLVIALVGVEIVCAEGLSAPLPDLLIGVAALAPALFLTWRSGRMRTGEGRTMPPAAFACLVGLLLLPLPTEFLRGSVLDRSLSLELALLAGLRNLTLGLVVLSQWRAACRCALAASAAMTLFAAVMALGEWGRWLLIAYGLLACLWLVASYWRRLEGIEASQCFPYGLAAGLALFIATFAALVTIGPERVAAHIASWLPSSGGDGGSGPNARGGLGDGDETTNARFAPRSAGITDSDLMLESAQPSLYDLVNEQYGPPLRSPGQDQAQAMDGKKKKQDFVTAENYRVSRDFPLLRGNPKPHDEHSELPDALLYVQGRVPQHLRLEAFVDFDGAKWSAAEQSPRALQLHREYGTNWFAIEGRLDAPFEAGSEQLTVKVTKLSGAVLPLPRGVERFRLGKINLAHFFAWDQEDLLKLRDRDLPTGFAIDAQIRTLDWEQVALADFPAFAQSHLRCRKLPENWPLKERLGALARKWTKNVPAGWPQIQSVIERLRNGYALDLTYRPTGDTADALEDFLFVGKRGPDYQFASAAALLLRSLGYATRMVTGFYVNPKRFDSATGHTFVQRDDLHTWLEVLGPENQWITLEPSPGFQLAAPSYGWLAQTWRAFVALSDWIAARPVASAVLGVSILLVLALPRRLQDLAATLAWRLRPRGDWRGEVLAALRLVERRARWAGQPRPIGQTHWRWVRQLKASHPVDGQPEIEAWLRLAEVALYAPPELPPPCPHHEACSCAEAAVRCFTIPSLRAATMARAKA